MLYKPSSDDQSNSTAGISSTFLSTFFLRRARFCTHPFYPFHTRRSFLTLTFPSRSRTTTYTIMKFSTILLAAAATAVSVMAAPTKRDVNPAFVPDFGVQRGAGPDGFGYVVEADYCD